MDKPTFKEWTDEYVADNIHKLKAPVTKQDEAWERLKQILEADPELMAVFRRMKDR